ncbi:MAG: RNA polymerase factor sigma-54 [Gammaproteobacteria bacterium]|nr:RNA polymerase factor sigma-54 [Gammaproteobacteria bacterium]
MRQSLELKLGQRLALTPQLQQAIKLLQLSAMDLRQEMQEALEQNPLLEEAEDNTEEREETGPEEESTSDAVADDYTTGLADDDAGDGAEPYYSNSQIRSHDGTAFDIDQRNSAPPSLKDHLREQMRLTPFSPTDQQIAHAIIDAVNDDGYLDCDLDEIRQSIEVEAGHDEIETVLHQIQNYDPAGVGARSLQECLRVQLHQLAPETRGLALAMRIVDEHLECLGARDLAQLRRKTNSTDAGIRTAVDLIQSLNPRPGTSIASSAPDYVIPDIIVTQDHSGWRVELNPEALPRIRVNNLYSDIAKDKHATDHQYIQNQLQEARWLVKSLENRNETLLRVAREIVKRQHEFLEHGETAMKPLVLHDISEALELHESTISRATTNKYMLTPRGVFELKYFFSTGLSTSSGDMTSATAIQWRIRKLVNEEPENKPHSDSRLTQMLNQEGINVARRTVAKYREALNIPPSSQRKTL